MIEVIYKEETAEQDGVQETFSMPRNVRQIGLANGNYRIYVEDYVYTFLKRLSEEEKEQGKAAVLTGEIKWTEDMICVFVKGALAADEMEATVELCTASVGCGDHGSAGENTFKVFWRGKDPDTDGTGGT